MGVTTIIPSTNHNDIVETICMIAPDGANFTNGTYITQETQPLAKILPTLIAGFQFILTSPETRCFHQLPIVVLLNSDKSLKECGLADYSNRNERQRAADVGYWLEQCFPSNQIILGFYDEKTPADLYKKLNEAALTRTHHKWGYGTDPSKPIIVGAEYFDMTFGIALPDSTNPVCHTQTAMPNPADPQKIITVNLTGQLISRDRELLFPNAYSGALASASPPVTTLWKPTTFYTVSILQRELTKHMAAPARK